MSFFWLNINALLEIPLSQTLTEGLSLGGRGERGGGLTAGDKPPDVVINNSGEIPTPCALLRVWYV